MKTIRNTTPLPLRISLSRGKVLHLGPDRTGQISDSEAELKTIFDLLAQGRIEMVDEQAHGAFAGERGSSERTSTHSRQQLCRNTGSGNR